MERLQRTTAPNIVCKQKDLRGIVVVDGQGSMLVQERPHNIAASGIARVLVRDTALIERELSCKWISRAIPYTAIPQIRVGDLHQLRGTLMQSLDASLPSMSCSTATSNRHDPARTARRQDEADEGC